MIYMSVTLRNVAVTSRRNVANQRSYVIIIAREEGGAWERIIINAPQGRGLGNGGSEWSGAFGHGGGEGRCRTFSHGGGELQCRAFTHGYTEVGRYAQSSRPDGQLSQHL